MLYPPFLCYLAAVNIIAFALFAVDKMKAVRHKWRIRESVLLGTAIIGGSPGALLGMKLCHHKTRKPLFMIGVPLILIIQIALMIIISVKIL